MAYLELLEKIPLINKLLTLIIKTWKFKNKFFSWPNIKARKSVVPERIGNISPKEIAKEAEYLIRNEQYLRNIKVNLSKLRGKNGAVVRMTSLIINVIKKIN